jgi:hypothetical protein
MINNPKKPMPRAPSPQRRPPSPLSSSASSYNSSSSSSSSSSASMGRGGGRGEEDAEETYVRLARQHRQLERDHKVGQWVRLYGILNDPKPPTHGHTHKPQAYSEEAHAIIRRQRATLEQLEGENARLKEEVALEARALALQERRRRRGQGVGAAAASTAHASSAATGGADRGKSPGSLVCKTVRRYQTDPVRINQLPQITLVVNHRSPQHNPPIQYNATQAWLQEQLQRFLRANARERRVQSKAQAEIAVLRAKVDQQRRALGGVHAARDGYLQWQRRVALLEGRLEKALARRDEAVAANRTLRAEIDGLRRERLRFVDTYQRLEREAGGCDREMAAAIEACNLAYEQRDAAQVGRVGEMDGGAIAIRGGVFVW